MPLRACIAILALALTSAFAGAAAGQSLVTTSYGPFTVTSTSGTQLSNGVYSINTTTLGVLQVQYTASPGHCSDVRAHILFDGIERGLTAFLSAGQARFTDTERGDRSHGAVSKTLGPRVRGDDG